MSTRESSTGDEDYEAEAARQASQTCPHGKKLDTLCKGCEETPAGWAPAPCSYCQTTISAKCQNGGCCSNCRHSVLPKGKGSRMVMSPHSGRMTPQIFDL